MILVTGGAGYIGSHYVRYERDRGSEVLVLDDLRLGHRAAIDDSPLLIGDLNNAAVVDLAFRTYTIESVVHFAAYTSVPESVAHPDRYYGNNVVPLIHLLDSMVRHNVRNIVFSSSCATYGDPQYIPIDEQHPQAPLSPYGESKRVCEGMLQAYGRAYGVRYASLRYFNASGAHPFAAIGESHEPETHLIPIVLQAALGKRDKVVVYGADYPTPDGSCVRDYIHVCDLAEAHALALDRLRSGVDRGEYNLGSETGSSVLEVIAACRRITGRRITVEMGPRRPGDPPQLVAASKKARTELGWRPSHPDLDEIVATAWKWETNRRY